MAEPSWWETIEAKGDVLFDRIKELIAQGNIRRVRVRHKDHVLAEFPLTLGVVGALIAPMLAAIAAITALVTECTVEVERTDKPAG